MKSSLSVSVFVLILSTVPTLGLALVANAATTSGHEVNLAPLGAHYPIFVVEKSENPQNILIAYTKLDSGCKIERDPRTGEPFLDYYWMMDRQTYKPVHRLIKSGIQERLRVEKPAKIKPAEFQVLIKDLKELDQDLERPTLEVTARSTGPKKAAGSKCEVTARIKLGPSDENTSLKLDSIYTESETSLMPPFRKVKSVTLKGARGAEVRVADFERKYEARK